MSAVPDRERSTYIKSNAVIVALEYHSTIESKAEIIAGNVISSTANILKEQLRVRTSSANVYLELLNTLDSDATVLKPSLNSDANILKEQLTTIQSDARVLGSGSLALSILPAVMYGRGLIVQSNLPVYIVSGAMSSSQTIAYDVINGSTLDLLDSGISEPYYNYDWSYDWVTRQWNHCAVKFEARSSDNPYALNGETWTEVYNEQVIPKGSVKRFHQWRAHVWASGSRDFELHQFTVKAFFNYPSKATHTGII